MKERYNQLQTEQGNIIESSEFQVLIRNQENILADMSSVLTRVDELLRARSQGGMAESISGILESINTNDNIRIFIADLISKSLVSGGVDSDDARAFRNRLIYDDSFVTNFEEVLTSLHQIN